MTAKISASEPQIHVKLKGKYEGNTMEYLWKRGNINKQKNIKKDRIAK